MIPAERAVRDCAWHQSYLDVIEVRHLHGVPVHAKAVFIPVTWQVDTAEDNFDCYPALLPDLAYTHPAQRQLNFRSRMRNFQWLALGLPHHEPQTSDRRSRFGRQWSSSLPLLPDLDWQKRSCPLAQCC